MGCSGTASVPQPTLRLFFRTWRAEDLVLAFALWSDPRVTELIGGQFSEAQVRARLDTELDLQQRHRLRELFAGHHPANAASKRAVEKLGMRYSHDELYPPTGLHHPSYILTADDYRRGLPPRNR
jgi:RimJ/RimL family protein N-acetyltransferase